MSDRFAAARNLKPGDVVHAIFNGRLERVHLVGTAVSPEYVFASQGGAPDDTSFGIWWIDGQRMTEAFDMQGAFNQVSLRLHGGVAEQPALTALDRLLEPYGSVGSVGRDRQLSTKIVSDAEAKGRDELERLERERGQLESRISELRQFERDYRQQLRNYIEGKLRDLDSTATASGQTPVAAIGL